MINNKINKGNYCRKYYNSVKTTTKTHQLSSKWCINSYALGHHISPEISTLASIIHDIHRVM